MGAAAQDIFEVDRCDPAAKLVAGLDEVEAQLIIGDIEFLPTSGGNAEQMDLDLFAGFQTGQILVPISLKEMDTADLFALISADVETFILKIFYQGVGAFVNMALENRSCQIVKCNIDRIDNGNIKFVSVFRRPCKRAAVFFIIAGEGRICKIFLSVKWRVCAGKRRNSRRDTPAFAYQNGPNVAQRAKN